MIKWFLTRLRFPWVMLHNTGAYGTKVYACGKPAFYLREHPLGKAAESRMACHLDGRPMEKYSRPVCDSCGAHVALRSMDVVRRGWW